MLTLNKNVLKMVLLLLVNTLACSVHAVMIDGEMSVTGYFVPTGGTTLAEATGIDFMDADGQYGTDGGAFMVGAVSGDFASYITPGGFFAPTLGSIADLDFTAFPSVTPFWQVGGFFFDLLSISITKPGSLGDSLILRGYGEVYGNNFERTMGSWVLTANGGQSTFSWSATVKTPESSALILLGIGILALFIARRRG